MFTDVVHAMAGAPGQGAGAQGPGAMISSFMPLILPTVDCTGLLMILTARRLPLRLELVLI